LLFRFCCFYFARKVTTFQANKQKNTALFPQSRIYIHLLFTFISALLFLLFH